MTSSAASCAPPGSDQGATGAECSALLCAPAISYYSVLQSSLGLPSRGPIPEGVYMQPQLSIARKEALGDEICVQADHGMQAACMYSRESDILQHEKLLDCMLVTAPVYLDIGEGEVWQGLNPELEGS